MRRPESDGRSSRMDGAFYDALEAREPAEREAALMAALPQVIAAARQHAPAYRDRLAQIRPEDITDRRALAGLPLTRKSDLIELQGQTEQQLKPIADLRPVAYVGTPSFLKILVDRAAEQGSDIGSIKKALVGAEAFPSALRVEFEAHGIAALQCYGTADLGLIAYESFAPDGSVCPGMVLDEGVIVELVQPGTGDPVAPGEVREGVVTTLTPEYPLIRFATGDLSALLPGHSPSRRTNHRIRGWLGRADQTAKVRGMVVHPVQIAEISRRHQSIIRARLVIQRPAAADQMTRLVEMGEPAEEATTT